MTTLATSTIPPVEQFNNMIWQHVNRAMTKMPRGLCGMDIDDLYAEGLLTYVKMTKKFRPERGCKFITLFYMALWQRMDSVIRKAHHQHLSQFAIDDDGESTDYAIEDRSVPTQHDLICDLFEIGRAHV